MGDVLDYDDCPPEGEWVSENTADGIAIISRPFRRAWPFSVAWIVLSVLAICWLLLGRYGIVPSKDPGTTCALAVLFMLWGCSTLFYFRHYLESYSVGRAGVTYTIWRSRLRSRHWALSEVDHFVVEHRMRNRLDRRGRYHLELVLINGTREALMSTMNERVTIWLAAKLRQGLERARAIPSQ